MFSLLKSELKRIAAPLALFSVAAAFAYAVGISQANLEIIVFKFLIFPLALVTVHIARQHMFPYLDLETSVFFDPDVTLSAAIKDAATILGVFFFYVGMTYVLVSAI
jgi:hypothetical protein